MDIVFVFVFVFLRKSDREDLVCSNRLSLRPETVAPLCVVGSDCPVSD